MGRQAIDYLRTRWVVFAPKPTTDLTALPLACPLDRISGPVGDARLLDVGQGYAKAGD